MYHIRRWILFVVFLSTYTVGASDIDDQFARSSVQFNPVLQTDFFPGFPMDLKRMLVNEVSKQTPPVKLARVCKAWYRFIIDRDFIGLKILRMLSNLSPRGNPNLSGCSLAWAESRDIQLWQTAALCIHRKNIESRIELLRTWPGEYRGPAHSVTLNPGKFFSAAIDTPSSIRFLIVPLILMKKWLMTGRGQFEQLRPIFQADFAKQSVCVLTTTTLHGIYGDRFRCNFGFIITTFRKLSGYTIGQLYRKIHKRSLDLSVVDNAGRVQEGKNDRLEFSF